MLGEKKLLDIAYKGDRIVKEVESRHKTTGSHSLEAWEIVLDLSGNGLE
jgi:hypothetical protein